MMLWRAAAAAPPPPPPAMSFSRWYMGRHFIIQLDRVSCPVWLCVSWQRLRLCFSLSLCVLHYSNSETGMSPHGRLAQENRNRTVLVLSRSLSLHSASLHLFFFFILCPFSFSLSLLSFPFPLFLSTTEPFIISPCTHQLIMITNRLNLLVCMLVQHWKHCWCKACWCTQKN